MWRCPTVSLVPTCAAAPSSPRPVRQRRHAEEAAAHPDDQPNQEAVQPGGGGGERTQAPFFFSATAADGARSPAYAAGLKSIPILAHSPCRPIQLCRTLCAGRTRWQRGWPTCTSSTPWCAGVRGGITARVQGGCAWVPMFARLQVVWHPYHIPNANVTSDHTRPYLTPPLGRSSTAT